MILTKYLSSENKILLEKSLLNYHCNGIHSLVLLEDDDTVTRLMITSTEHELWNNACGQTYKGWKELSIPAAQYDFDINIEIINGWLWVPSFKSNSKIKSSHPVNVCHWNMQDGLGIRLDPVGKSRLALTEFKTMVLNRKYTIPKNELHTYYVTRLQNSAWLEVTKKPVETEKKVVYSNGNWNSAGLYVKPTIGDIKDILRLIKLDLYD